MRSTAGLARLALLPAALAGVGLAASLLLEVPLLAKEPAAYRIVAGAAIKQKRDAPVPPGSTTAATHLKGLSVSVELADGPRRARFLRAIDPGMRDPFATPAGRPDLCLTFVVTFDNQSPADVIFQPGNVALVTNRGERAFALDVTDFYLRAERAGVADLQKVIDRTTEVIFDSSTTIPGGQRMARLLAFRPIDGKWDQFQVHFSFLQIGAETHTISFMFHKEVLKS